MTANTTFPAWMEQQVNRESQPVELSPEEGDSFALFAALDTQWQRHAMTGLRLGLDYGKIEPTAQMLGIAVSARRFLDLRIMEAAALTEFGKARR